MFLSDLIASRDLHKEIGNKMVANFSGGRKHKIFV